MNDVFKFRGCDKLYYGTCTESVDDSGNASLAFSTPKILAPVVEVGVTTASESSASYGNNKALIVVNSEGTDEITFSVFGIPADVLADLTGKHYDASKQMYINRERDFNYLYVMWREKLTTGKYRYRVAYKGTFNVPDTTVATEDDGTESNGQDITFTSIFTEKVFSDGKSSKGYFVEDGVKTVNVDEFFAELKTQDEFTLPTE